MLQGQYKNKLLGTRYGLHFIWPIIMSPYSKELQISLYVSCGPNIKISFSYTKHEVHNKLYNTKKSAGKHLILWCNLEQVSYVCLSVLTRCNWR